ncbi:hypothetical protein DIPPA_21431 [Diplonema papillatum]|nr:hypothetical protein DIPPA_21431 [Diplonema papillatum]
MLLLKLVCAGLACVSASAARAVERLQMVGSDRVLHAHCPGTEIKAVIPDGGGEFVVATLSALSVLEITCFLAHAPECPRGGYTLAIVGEGKDAEDQPVRMRWPVQNISGASFDSTQLFFSQAVAVADFCLVFERDPGTGPADCAVVHYQLASVGKPATPDDAAPRLLKGSSLAEAGGSAGSMAAWERYGDVMPAVAAAAPVANFAGLPYPVVTGISGGSVHEGDPLRLETTPPLRTLGGLLARHYAGAAPPNTLRQAFVSAPSTSGGGGSSPSPAPPPPDTLPAASAPPADTPGDAEPERGAPAPPLPAVLTGSAGDLVLVEKLPSDSGSGGELLVCFAGAADAARSVHYLVGGGAARAPAAGSYHVCSPLLSKPFGVVTIFTQRPAAYSVTWTAAGMRVSFAGDKLDTRAGKDAVKLVEHAESCRLSESKAPASSELTPKGIAESASASVDLVITSNAQRFRVCYYSSVDQKWGEVNNAEDVALRDAGSWLEPSPTVHVASACEVPEQRCAVNRSSINCGTDVLRTCPGGSFVLPSPLTCEFPACSESRLALVVTIESFADDGVSCLLSQLTGPVLGFPVDDLVVTVNATLRWGVFVRHTVTIRSPCQSCLADFHGMEAFCLAAFSVSEIKWASTPAVLPDVPVDDGGAGYGFALPVYLVASVVFLGVLTFLMLLAWINQKSLFRST